MTSGASEPMRSTNSSNVAASTTKPGISDFVVNTSASGSQTAVTVNGFVMRESYPCTGGCAMLVRPRVAAHRPTTADHIDGHDRGQAARRTEVLGASSRTAEN